MSTSLRARRAAILALGLVLAACGDDSRFTGPGGRTPDLSDARAFVSDGAYVADLVECVDPRRLPTSCAIGVLPPIGRDREVPSVEALLERVVVSHEWMGERFAEILPRLPAELRQILGAVTAIVIDADVRPSFYWPLTGAIYVDPRHLWRTPEEEATISREPDYRSGFGADLGFVTFSTYLANGVAAFADDGDLPRDLDGRVAAVAALLFHEGAHANDFLPPEALATVSDEETFVDATDRLEGHRLSDALAGASPLVSEVWLGLAEVLYRGASASDAQRRLTAADVGLAFEPDGANDPYGYSSRQEDFAMLFEEAMLKRHFDFDRRVGFAEPPEEGGGCRAYRVGWGVVHRIAAASVLPRARLVIEQLLGDPLDAFFDSLPAPSAIAPGGDLCLDGPGAPASVLRWM